MASLEHYKNREEEGAQEKGGLDDFFVSGRPSKAVFR
jgi:hypothetical protein